MRFPVESFPVPHKGPVEFADELGLLAPDVLLVHLTDIRSQELDRVAASGASVVLCPRSNLFIEMKLPPLLELLKVGIIPALGTDSLASNASFDVLAEARALADRFPSVSASLLVQMATAAGARALGRPDLGRLAKGLRPSLLSIEGPLGPNDDPCVFVLRQPLAKRKWVLRSKGESPRSLP
jgi:cytosine/adenosine deaminase-related metal-dependent hydrolase